MGKYLIPPTDGGPPKLSISPSSSSLSKGGRGRFDVTGILVSTGATSPMGASSKRPPSNNPPAEANHPLKLKASLKFSTQVLTYKIVILHASIDFHGLIM